MPPVRDSERDMHLILEIIGRNKELDLNWARRSARGRYDHAYQEMLPVLSGVSLRLRR